MYLDVTYPSTASRRFPSAQVLGRLWRALPNAARHTGTLKQRFVPVATALSEHEDEIVTDLLAAQGPPVELGGYYRPDVALAIEQMRPSKTFNRILDGLSS